MSLRYHRVALTIPGVVVRQCGSLYNSFFLILPDDEVIGRYDKVRPTPHELAAGVIPGKNTLIK